MNAPTPLPVRRRRRFFPLLSAAIFLAGCTARTPTPTQPLLGVWRGTMSSGNLTVPTEWALRGDGSQSVTLTFPQGQLTSQGTFAFHDGLLARRTTARVIVIHGEKKTMPLVNPMEAAYQCRVTGDTLTLTRTDTPEKITLTRGKE